MGDVLLTAEVVLGVLFALPIAFVCWVIVRRWLITKDHLMILMARRRGDFWVMGMTRTQAASIEWFPVLGIGLTPGWTVRREDAEFGPPLAAEKVPSVIQEPVLVDCTVGGEVHRLAISRGDYTQLRSWSESSPPGFNSGRY
ncbi:uncharacterized protein DUF2550 [Yimella lutea]|uniref:Uncharacterized protein DUF2550 n=1 Tax=Yimella lutea TaxID=587872 RepID=A0A542EF42_9MICO|nr:DUF2550 family protein [Yimella lutea]TQJ13929.1 uncharacterized protein DUF2550 [Yimella lutea]